MPLKRARSLAVVQCLRMEEAVAGFGVGDEPAMAPEDEEKQRYFYSMVRETIVRMF